MNINTDDSIRMQNQPDPATLEREIDRQRDHINELVNTLTSKLGGNLNTGDLMNQLGSTVKANPVPALVTLAGLAWLYSSRDKPVEAKRHVHVGSEETGPYTGTGAVGTMGATGNLSPSMGTPTGTGSDGGGRLQNLRQGASEKWVSTKEGTRDRAQRVNQGYQQMLENNPLAAGAIGIAVGALLGALLPATHKEDEMLGQVSSRMKQGAKDLARTGYEKAAEAGREVTSRPNAGDGGGVQRSPTSTVGPTPTQGQPS